MAVAFEDQRVDLGQAGVAFHVAGVELLEHVDRLRLRGLGHADAAGEFQPLRVRQPGQRVDEDLEQLLRRLVRHFLDIHAAFTAGHHRDGLRRPVGHGGDVVLLLDVGTLLDQQTAHLLALGAGLVRLQLHAEDFAGQLLHLIKRTRQLDAAALAASAGMDLRLHHPDRAAELLRRLDSLVHGESGIAARHGHARLAQEFLALVFMDLHDALSCEMGEGWETASNRGAVSVPGLTAG